MIQLIVTADDALHERLRRKLDAGDLTSLRAINAPDGFRLASVTPVDRVIVDMSLHAADTLIEALHARPETARILIYLVTTGGQVPLALRRLCADVLEEQGL